MSARKIGGVIAAIATPLTANREPDAGAFIALANWLLEGGCDGLNVLGTTGEATSFSVSQRMGLMRSLAAARSDLSNLLVGTGAAALADAVALTREASALGFGGALVIPPFYYKNISDDGLLAYVDTLAKQTANTNLPLYLYNFPAMSGVVFSVPFVELALKAFGDRLAGLKDSSGDMAYARAMAAVSDRFAVFPSSEATLKEARDGRFAGCISATANVNAAFCARAFHDGDDAALATAVRIRALFDGKPLVAGVKALLSRIHTQSQLADVVPPLMPWSERDTDQLLLDFQKIQSAAPPR